MSWRVEASAWRPSGERWWARTHAQVPTPIWSNDELRVYFTSRDDAGRSRVGYVVVDPDAPTRVIRENPEPVLGLGAPGTHDEDGAMIGSLVQAPDRLLMYYTGWSKGVTVSYRVSVGLAESLDGGESFRRVFEGPVVDRTPREAYMTMSPEVMPPVRAGEPWRMWYGSGTGWVDVNGKNEPLYVIKYAESDDGLSWRQDDVTAITAAHPEEANTRPAVRRTEEGSWEMYFSYRGSRGYRGGETAYRIGYARSADGRTWTRGQDPEALGVRPEHDWRSWMTAYPSLTELPDGRRLLYFNGDGFGQSGFAAATWRRPV